jgi:ABC-2 type transport system ATP-binding protein
VAGIRELIGSLAGTHTIILSTHILAEVEALCPRAILIAKGKLLAQGTLAEIKARAPGGDWYFVEIAGIEAPRLGSLPEVELVEPLGAADGYNAFRVRAPADPRAAIARFAAAGQHPIRALERRLPTLEDAFLGIVGRE